MAYGERLGCASTYTVALHWQGGERVYTYLEKITKVAWSRERRAVSTCTVELSKPDISSGCVDKLRNVWPWAHEVTVYRDGRVVWQGPLIRYPAENRTTITLTAKDVGRFFGARLLRQTRKLTDTDLSAIARAAVESTLAVRDPGILANIAEEPAGVTADRTIRAYSRTGADELDEIAKQGMDWCFVGRRLVLAPVADGDTRPQAQLTATDLLPINVAIMTTVRTDERDRITGEFQTVTKALLNVAPRNVYHVWQIASLGYENRIQPLPNSVLALLP